MRINVDAQALIAREQAATGAVSPAMLAVTSLRHLTPDKERGPSRRSCLLDRVQRAWRHALPGPRLRRNTSGRRANDLCKRGITGLPRAAPAVSGMPRGSVVAGQVAVGVLGQPRIGGQVFLAEPECCIRQVPGGIRVHNVAQVIAVDAGAPCVAAESQRDVPDLPAFAPCLARRAAACLVLDRAHRSPRSVSAASIALP